MRWFNKPFGLLAIGSTLLVLTATSYFLSRLHLGAAGLPVALLIAVCKSALIGAFFMQLIEGQGLSVLVLGTAVVFVLVLLLFVLGEAATRFTPSLPLADLFWRARSACFS